MTYHIPLLTLLIFSQSISADLRGTGDLGVIIEREPAAIQIINTTSKSSISRITDLGDLSHASVVFSRDARYAFIFGRDGGLTKIDLLQDRIAKRIIQAGNSIGGAISQDGTLIAVSNYTPGGVKIFTTETLELVADIPALYGDNQLSKVVGLVDAPGQKFIFSLFDAGEIWIADLKDPAQAKIQKFKAVGKQPYDALLSPDGRYYIAGLFGDRGLALLDLWSPEQGVKRILPDYAKQDEKLPVYKMPHLEGWAVAGNLMFIPAIGQHEVLVIDQSTWQLIKRIPVIGQPVFVMARPDGRQVWVNYAFPDNAHLQIIDVKTLSLIKSLNPGKAVLHMEFTPRGENIWVSARDDNRVVIYDTNSFKEITRIPANKPSGIFFSSRAHKMGL
ncbi:protein NirF [Bathymodiolus platifrons methanotrophic gill symbiont]|uniref:cytochrome D1 domain-containing protein n=1 Tax=Bathymodiolus platifrons methanotrophic gill symbiont TaxID=113268 RepID=UPI000B413449|nr:cytochrome D1 domain-containing protein [Bathymodiolus platifrons methanotrophic gill symbiont]MCK5870014.1 protein nirF [Methyloprofundus sp.]TXK94549.1 protein nirF [Methylococcaceae bacterium CS4]TXL01310.1 protein nirF [Methylococcaceae bacterium CS5]TXL08930.1 protein nirF [Methylococcaceae bacterium CS1]TXL09237.1 protein nirF [Methylococcaceae bacterium CS3]TXL11885.1 protein nirF [Methylococcaceae bacterium CS2]TXL16135.1 protein nirF [Methylococcaceae bacterium HT4]TXL20285.1 pr